MKSTNRNHLGCPQDACKLGSGGGNGSETDPLADEEVVAVDVGVEAEELLQGQPGSLRHREARLVLFHPVRLLADQRRGCRSPSVCVCQGDHHGDEKERDNESGGATLRHYKCCRARVKEARNNEHTADRCV